MAKTHVKAFEPHLADALEFDEWKLTQPERPHISMVFAYIDYTLSLIPRDVYEQEMERRLPEKMAGIQRMGKIFSCFPKIRE